MNLTASTIHALHLVSAVIWIGGLGFVVMTLTPSFKKLLPKESIQKLTKEIQTRYLRITGVLVAIMLLTGAANVHFTRGTMTVSEGFGKTWMVLLAIKITLFTFLVSIYFLNHLYRNNPQDPDETGVPWARPSFILGILIVIAAAFLKHAH